MKTFPKGFESWRTTHHDVVCFITNYIDVAPIESPVHKIDLYEYCEELTDKFEKEYIPPNEYDYYEDLIEFLEKEVMLE